MLMHCFRISKIYKIMFCSDNENQVKYMIVQIRYSQISPFINNIIIKLAIIMKYLYSN